jgi:hypothetical protein
MRVMSVAVAAALHFDHELAANPKPLVGLVETLATLGRFRQSYIDAQNHKMRPPSALRLDSLIMRVARGETSGIGIETAIGTPDADTLNVRVDTTPVAKHPERYTLTKCRYQAFIGLGAHRVQGIDALIAFAEAIAVRAGAIYVADTAEYAMALASGGGSPTLTRAQIDRITDGLYWRPRWGDVVRGPAWGTFLGAPHIEKLGGIARVEREAGCYRVISLRSGGAYLQTTPEPTDAVSEALVRFLEPVLPRRSTET